MSTQPATFGTYVPSSVIPLSTDSLPTARRFSVDEYHRMIQSGILTQSDHVQLIDGWIIEMPPIGPEHSTSTSLLEAAIQRCLPPGWILRRGDPITLAAGEPEPDVVVARGTIRDYAKRHPGPGDIALVIEVADTTLSFDRAQKAREYAAAGIPEYWIVNLVDRQIEIHRDPQTTATGPEYRYREVLVGSATIKLQLQGKQVGEFQLEDLLP